MNNAPFFEEAAPLFNTNKQRGQEKSKDVAIKLNSFSFGDTLSATPTIRKLAEYYAKKIIVCTHKPFLFEHNPYVLFTIHVDDFKQEYYDKYEVFDTFNSIGKADRAGIEKKYAAFDIRKIHCTEIGFDLMPEELHCDYYPGTIEFNRGDQDFLANNKYAVVHIGQNWPSRTWPKESYVNLIRGLNRNHLKVALVGFDQKPEPGQYNHDKTCYNFDALDFEGVSFLNRTSLDQDYYITKNSEACVTMDTGQLHLAGCTDAHIIFIGASVHPFWRAPYRKGSQSYKMTFVGGTCEAFCASDPKYSVIEHGTVNSVPPLPFCLEGRPNFDCQPRWEDVLSSTLKVTE